MFKFGLCSHALVLQCPVSHWLVSQYQRLFCCLCWVPQSGTHSFPTADVKPQHTECLIGGETTSFFPYASPRCRAPWGGAWWSAPCKPPPSWRCRPSPSACRPSGGRWRWSPGRPGSGLRREVRRWDIHHGTICRETWESFKWRSHKQME